MSRKTVCGTILFVSRSVNGNCAATVAPQSQATSDLLHSRFRLAAIPPDRPTPRVDRVRSVHRADAEPVVSHRPIARSARSECTSTPEGPTSEPDRPSGTAARTAAGEGRPAPLIAGRYHLAPLSKHKPVEHIAATESTDRAQELGVFRPCETLGVQDMSRSHEPYGSLPIAGVARRRPPGKAPHLG